MNYDEWMAKTYGPDPHPGGTLLWAILLGTAAITGLIALVRWWFIHACDWGC